jgi:hypothetical protein
VNLKIIHSKENILVSSRENLIDYITKTISNNSGEIILSRD